MYLRRIEYDSNYANKIFTLKFFETLRVHCILVFCIEKEALQREGPTRLVRRVGGGASIYDYSTCGKQHSPATLYNVQSWYVLLALFKTTADMLKYQ